MALNKKKRKKDWCPGSGARPLDGVTANTRMHYGRLPFIKHPYNYTREKPKFIDDYGPFVVLMNKVRCPSCSRKFKPHLVTCHDGAACCRTQVLPKHKTVKRARTAATLDKRQEGRLRREAGMKPSWRR
jgi:hypothetical protein